jgi:hypothetical protein
MAQEHGGKRYVELEFHNTVAQLLDGSAVFCMRCGRGCGTDPSEAQDLGASRVGVCCQSSANIIYLGMPDEDASL